MLLVSVAVIITVISTEAIFSSAVSIPTVGIVIVVPIGKQRINYFPIKSGRVIIPTHNFYLKAVRDLRFDNLPSGWSGSSTERFSGWDIIPTQVPYRCCGQKKVSFVPNQ
jgi:hypothetical protein